ncbi:MAG TPA: hypothetical protein VJ183_08290 [Chloroflexia bacterium]|nr:hypothetical protein [Chloroflexia bacterium]
MGKDARADYDAVVSEIVSSSGATTGAMFGMPCLKHGGKAFAGFYEGAMVFKLGGEAHAEALALAGAHLFDPSGRGRPMKEWVVVPHEYVERWGELAGEALEYCVVTNRGVR